MIPARGPVERAAIAGYGLGAVALTAVFGLRTLLTQPDFTTEPWDLRALAIHGAAEMILALLVALLAVKVRWERGAKAILLVPAVLVIFPKLLFIAVTFGIEREAEPWTYSFTTQLLCAVVSVPLAVTFLPVITAVAEARGGPGRTREDGAPPPVAALDRPLEVRAALFVWLLTVALATIVLGPDRLVRLAGAVVLACAVTQYLAGRRDEEALITWARRAVSQGPPAFVTLPESPADSVPSVYPDHPRKVTLCAAGDQTGTYRQDPDRRPLAALDPSKLDRPRLFRDRVRARLLVPLVYTSLAVALTGLALHDRSLPPRVVAEAFDHYPVTRFTAQEVEGLTLWQVARGPYGNHLAGYDPAARRVVDGDELFRRFRGRTPPELATLAHMILFNGWGSLLQGADPGSPLDADGNPPKAPYVDAGKLHFWVRSGTSIHHHDVPVTPEMVRDEGPPARRGMP